MNPDFKELLSAFNAADARSLIVGAYAVIHYSEPRYTKDLDIWIEPTAENAARVMRALAEFGAPLEGLRVEDLCDREMVYQIGIEPNRIDILMGISGLEFAEVWPRAEATNYGSIPVRLLSLDDLIAAKRAAARPQDLLDLKKLEKTKQRNP